MAWVTVSCKCGLESAALGWLQADLLRREHERKCKK